MITRLYDITIINTNYINLKYNIDTVWTIKLFKNKYIVWKIYYKY